MKKTSTVIITLTNSSLSDGDLLSERIYQSLNEYLELIKQGTAGNELQENYSSTNGTDMCIIAANSQVVDIPNEDSLLFPRQAGSY